MDYYELPKHRQRRVMVTYPPDFAGLGTVVGHQQGVLDDCVVVALDRSGILLQCERGTYRELTLIESISDLERLL